MKDFRKKRNVELKESTGTAERMKYKTAINCLNCPDDMLEKYLIVVSLKYENIGRTIANNGDFKHHSYNRLYVYNTARMILA